MRRAPGLAEYGNPRNGQSEYEASDIRHDRERRLGDVKRLEQCRRPERERPRDQIADQDRFRKVQARDEQDERAHRERDGGQADPGLFAPCGEVGRDRRDLMTVTQVERASPRSLNPECSLHQAFRGEMRAKPGPPAMAVVA